jgi:hypothetical protein
MNRHGGRIRGLIVGAAVLLAALMPAVAWSAPPTLVLLGTDTLSVSAKQRMTTANAFVSIFNKGTETATITVTSAASSAAGVGVIKTPQPATIGPGDAQRVQVTFTGLTSLTSSVDGQLIVHGGATPIAKSVSITPAPQPAHLWARDFIFGSLILAAFAFLATVIWAWLCCPGKLTKAAPGPKWDFGTSWATNLTALGATLGTVLAAATLPAIPSQIDKETLVRLNLGFGLLVVAAPFLYHAIRKPARTLLGAARRWRLQRTRGDRDRRRRRARRLVLRRDRPVRRDHRLVGAIN